MLTSSCSPVYVIEAGWKEAGILWRREKISELIKDPEIEDDLKRRLELTKEAQNFAKELGLKVDGNFNYYSKVNGDVLVWVLNATESTSLNPKTWWFPIVGRITYKGYFDRKDGESMAASLESNGYDTSLRPSAAFSTLGWFDDPLLSTYLILNDTELVETIIHEIFHSTFWIKGDTAFNETAANFVGSIGTILFFENKFGKTSAEAEYARGSWHDELIFAHFLEDLYQELHTYYTKSAADNKTKEQIIIGKRKIYENAEITWNRCKLTLKTNKYQKFNGKLNNASLLALKTYLTKPWLLEQLYYNSGKTIPKFIASIKNLTQNRTDTNKDLFSLL